MPTSVHLRTSAADRGGLFGRTALCGALCGLSLLAPTPGAALPVAGAPPQVNAGGGLPTIVNGAKRTDVTLNAERTLINWNSFDVFPDETVSFNFGARNGTVLNRINTLTGSRIEGVVEGRVGGAYGGNVWFSSQSSIIFGRGAQVDAGSILAVLGTPSTTSFLDTANNLFSFNGADVLVNSKVWVLSNARLTAHGGMVALAGPSVVTRANATVTALDGSVLYGSAQNFQIRLAPGTGGDFDLVDFIVPAASDGVEERAALDIGGATQAGTVFLAAVNRSVAASTVISLSGVITATSARTDGGDIVLSAGGGIANRLPAPALASAGAADVYLGQGSASRDLQVSVVGRILPRPWVRSPSDLLDPPGLTDPITPPSNGGGNGNGGGNCFPFICAPIEGSPGGLSAGLFDPTAVSAISSGRDAKITATQTIELGRITAARDISVSGTQVKANALVAGRTLNVTSTVGDVLIANLSVGADSTVTAKTDAKIDAITAPGRLAVTSGRDVALGDGTSTVTGLISVTAPRDVLVNVGSAKIDTLSAGGRADLRGGAIEVATLNAQAVYGQAASLKLDNVTSAGDLYAVATGGDAVVGRATVGDDIYIIATGGVASLGDATLTGAAPDVVDPVATGVPDAAGNGRVVSIESTNFDARLGLGTGGVTGATAVSVRAGQDAIVEVLRETPGAVTVFAARDATLRAPTVRLDTVTSGRDLTVGSTVGDFVLTDSLSAVRNITVTAAGALRLANVTAGSGSVSLIGGTVTAGNVSASVDLTMRALSGGVTTASYSSGRDLILEGSSFSLGAPISSAIRDLSITSPRNLTFTTPLSAGRNLTLDVGGKAVLGQTSAGTGIRIAAADLDLTGLSTAPTIQIESRGGAITVGGTAGGGAGFVLDNNDFGQLRASGQVRVYAGLTTGTARGDITLQDLAINPAATPNVAFLAGSSNSAFVNGRVAPTARGGVLRIGDATDLNWRPNSILITGSLGAATFAGDRYDDVRPFDQVRLAARQDIIMGSPRFISLIQGTPVEGIDLAAGKPIGVAPTGDELLKTFITTSQLEVSGEGKVVSQNASRTGAAQSIGVLITAGASPALIIDPPQIVELWGTYIGPDGRLLSGSAASSALTFTVVDASGAPTTPPPGSRYRFNACDVGTTTCAVIAPTPSDPGATSSDGLLRIRDGLSDDRDEELSPDALSVLALTQPPPVAAVETPTGPDEAVTDPVTAGAGNEEIWRKRRQTK